MLQARLVSGMMNGNTGGRVMAASKIAISIDQGTLKKLDRLVKSHTFPSRSRAIQDAVEEKLKKLEKGRLARECSKLDPDFEKALAEEGFADEVTRWPEY